MAHKIGCKRSVEWDLQKLPKAEARRIIDQIEEELPEKADASPVLKGQWAGLRKIQVGDYRVICAILEDEVLVLRIGHRKDVYKKQNGSERL